MKVGDLVKHKDFPQSLAIIVETFGKPTGNRIHPPTIRVEWLVFPTGTGNLRANTFGSVWLEVVNV
tara:strand:- start:576 stop:773 length:198 start_codon:yes stop_codon:yes gene_type:complete